MHFVRNWSSALSAILILSNTFTVVTGDYVFVQRGDDIDGEAQHDLSGYSVALSNAGKVVAIGARANDGVNGTDSGHARVYGFDDGSWDQLGQDLDGEAANDWAGYQISLSSSGRIVAVGGVQNSEVDTYSGHVRVYEYNGNLWEQMGGDLDGEDSFNFFGVSLALSKNGRVLASAGIRYVQVHQYVGSSWVIVGQELERDSNRASKSILSLSSDGSVLAFGEYSSNRVKAFGYDSGSGLWVQRGQNITETDGRFGWAVSLSSDGMILGVGAYQFHGDMGKVSIYQYDGMTWSPLGNTLYGSQNNTFFGYDLELSDDGQRIVIGSNSYDDPRPSIGKVELFEYDGVGSWMQIGQDLIGEARFDSWGFAVAVSGNGRVVGAGAPGNDGVNGTNSGHVRVYRAKERTSPGASGDPHFKTWTGESYDFHGLCDLVLLKNQAFQSGLGMDIHIRTKKMKQWSYISNAVLRIGEDVFEVMGEANGNAVSYWVNGVAGNEKDLINNSILPNRIAGFPVYYSMLSTKQHEFSVDLGEDEKIVVKTWKDLVRVDLHGATEANFGESLGLMGTYSKGLHMGRNGVTVLTGFNEFGQEWQVLPSEPTLFHSREGKQAPEKCVIPSSTKLRRRLSENIISQEEAVIACARVDEEDRDMCIFDIMATNDKEISGAY